MDAVRRWAAPLTRLDDFIAQNCDIVIDKISGRFEHVSFWPKADITRARRICDHLNR